MIKHSLMMLSLAGLAACAHPKTRLVESEWASMTQSKVPNSTDVATIGPVKGEYCFSVFKKGHVGLMDEALKNAQSNHKIDYVKNAAFSMDNDGCVFVDGEGYKIKN